MLWFSKHHSFLAKRSSPPKRKSPGKSPRKKTGMTPSSSTKKRLATHLRVFAGAETSRTGVVLGSASSPKVGLTKRALFQSPDRLESSCSNSSFITGRKLAVLLFEFF